MKTKDICKLVIGFVVAALCSCSIKQARTVAPIAYSGYKEALAKMTSLSLQGLGHRYSVWSSKDSSELYYKILAVDEIESRYFLPLHKTLKLDTLLVSVRVKRLKKNIDNIYFVVGINWLKYSPLKKDESALYSTSR